MISGFNCGNCKAPLDQHVDGHCLFSPTKYRMMTAVELVEARRITFTTYEEAGIGVGNIRSVQKLDWNIP